MKTTEVPARGNNGFSSRRISRRRIWRYKVMMKLGHPDIRYKGWKRRRALRAFERRYDREPELRESLDRLYMDTWER